MTDSENLEECWLDEETLEELLRVQNECIFMWVNNAGQPFGVTMSYIWRDGSFWLTCAKARKRVPACLLYTSPSPRDQRGSRMPSSA